MKMSDATTRTEVIHKGLKLLERVLQHQETGGRLVLIDKEGGQETLGIL